MKKSLSGDNSVLSLFTGAGGLDLGLEEAGFSNRLCVEVDPDARSTLKKNRPGWILSTPGDIHELAPEQILSQANLNPGEVTLLVGGPPCQPFSKSAYWARSGARGLQDPRADTLKAYIKVISTAKPRVLLLENVIGLATKSKNDWINTLRIELQKINRINKTKYNPQVFYVNSADYGVPQIRERVFVLATADGQKFVMPRPTHGLHSGLEPFRTAWDAIGHLDVDDWPGELNPMGKWAALLSSIPEGHNYQWHTPRGKGEPLFGWRTRFWSFLLKLAKNLPSWTIQASPGPATGPFHWKSRLLSTAELARLQTFPVGYQVEGNRRSAHRQLGNAVPSAIGEMFGLEIRRQLLGEQVRQDLTLIPIKREDCPSPESPSSVPRQYLSLRSEHKDHPGIGQGPAARIVEKFQSSEVMTTGI